MNSRRVLFACTIVVGLCVLGKTTARAQFNVDHYLCWQYKSDSKGGLTTVTDDVVTNQQIELKKVKYVCNPAVKGAGSPQNPNDHLTCYHMKTLNASAPGINISDQFLNESLQSKNKAKLFCVPGNKS